MTTESRLLTQPAPLTLYAELVHSGASTTERVAFYRDTNNSGRWEEEDQLLGFDEDGSDGWSWTADTAEWSLGYHTFFARVQDDTGGWSGPASLRAMVASWQSPGNQFDVNGDGSVEPLDVLLIIKEINDHGSRVLPPRTFDNLVQPYFDVNGDGRITPLDVLLVIHHLNLNSSPQSDSGDGGEGEWATDREAVVQRAEPRNAPSVDRLMAGWNGHDVASARVSQFPPPARSPRARDIIGPPFDSDSRAFDGEPSDWDGLLDDSVLDLETLAACFVAVT